MTLNTSIVQISEFMHSQINLSVTLLMLITPIKLWHKRYATKSLQWTDIVSQCHTIFQFTIKNFEFSSVSRTKNQERKKLMVVFIFYFFYLIFMKVFHTTVKKSGGGIDAERERIEYVGMLGTRLIKLSQRFQISSHSQGIVMIIHEVESTHI